jgi:hypothetical protein
MQCLTRLGLYARFVRRDRGRCGLPRHSPAMQDDGGFFDMGGKGYSNWRTVVSVSSQVSCFHSSLGIWKLDIPPERAATPLPLRSRALRSLRPREAFRSSIRENPRNPLQGFAKSTSQKGDAMRTLRNVKRREGTRTGLFYRLFPRRTPRATGRGCAIKSVLR